MFSNITTYDKQECQTGVIHIGYGAFHRAHQCTTTSSQASIRDNVDGTLI